MWIQASAGRTLSGAHAATAEDRIALNRLSRAKLTEGDAADDQRAHHHYGAYEAYEQYCEHQKTAEVECRTGRSYRHCHRVGGDFRMPVDGV